MQRSVAVLALFVITFSSWALSAQPATLGDAARARVIELRDGTTRVDIGRWALVYDEHENEAPPAVLGFVPDARLFRPLRRFSDLSHGFTDTALWLCFTVRSAASDRSWIIAAGPNYTDSVTAYIIDPDGRSETQMAEAAEPSTAQGHAVSDFLFRLTIGPGEVKTVYLRFASQESLRIRASLWDAYGFIRADAADTTLVGLILGAILAVFVYTLFLVISLRELSYVSYLVYLVGLFFYVLAANGAGAWFLWPGNLWLEHRGTSFFACVMMAGILLFGRAYMETRKNSPVVDRILIGYLCLIPLFLLGLAFFDYRLSMRAGGVLLLAGLTAVLVAAIRCALSRERRAYYFLVSWIFVMTGVIVSLFGSPAQAGIYSELLWSKGEQIGALIQVLLLAFGISDAVNSMRLEKEEGQRRSIELLERANAVKEDFLVATSLEFRSPLYGIIGLVDRLDSLTTQSAGPEGRRLASLVQAESLRLLNSVSTIATYSQLRHGDIALAVERFSLREAIDGVTGVSSYLAAGKDIAVERDVEDVEMLSDIRALQQIVYNLFSDTLKRSSAGRVRVEAHGDGENVLIAVSGSGPPLSEEVLSRGLGGVGITGLETVGPGLELLVTRLLAERLGGGLSYDRSEGENRFNARLPRRVAWPFDQRRRSHHAPALPIAARVGTPPALGAVAPSVDLSATKDDGKRKGRILVADEDPVFLEALKHYLEERGYAVLPTVSMERAAELACGDGQFDLVLLDASGPSRAGLRACEVIRASRLLGELPVVIMTDRESSDAVTEAFRAGASDYLPKLAPTELLFARVDTQVTLRRAVQEQLETRRRIAELEKLKTLGVLAAGVAHEINTPNNAVLRNLPIISEVWTELAPTVRRLMEESGGFSLRGWSAQELLDNLPELVSDTYAAGCQIKKIVEDLKDYARDSSSSPPGDVDLSAVAAYASRLLAPLVERRTTRFVLEAPPGLPPARANFQKMTQVAVNVLENALQALDRPDAEVRLRTFVDPHQGALVLECRDEGRGIDPALRGRLFEPFFTTKRDSGGTGLGLPVALGIVRESGGDIQIDSAPGKGTTVRVVLPLERPE